MSPRTKQEPSIEADGHGVKVHDPTVRLLDEHGCIEELMEKDC